MLRIILRYFHILHLDFRLLAKTQKLPITKENVSSRFQRRSRHDLRIKLLAISYAVDISSGFTLFFLTKIGARTLFIERMLISLAVFLYSIPVPFAYLFSELRVRNIVLEKGWFQGIKSIFATTETIKNENVGFRLSQKKVAILETLQAKNRNFVACSIHDRSVQIDWNDCVTSLPGKGKDMVSTNSNELTKTNEGQPLRTLVSRRKDVESNHCLNNDVNYGGNDRDIRIEIPHRDTRYSNQRRDVSSSSELPEIDEDPPLGPIVHQPEHVDSHLHLENESTGINWSDNKKLRHVEIPSGAIRLAHHTFSPNESAKIGEDWPFGPMVNQLHYIGEPDVDVNTTTKELDDISFSLDMSERSMYYEEELQTPINDWQAELEDTVSFHSTVQSLSLTDHSMHSRMREGLHKGSGLNHPNSSTSNDKTVRFQMFNDTKKIEVAFPGQADDIIKILRDETFEIFQRTYITQKILKLLNGDYDEALYYKHYKFICWLEGHSMMRIKDDSLPNFIVPLINVWYLKKKGSIEEMEPEPTEGMFENAGNLCNSVGLQSIRETKCTERKRIIRLMLKSKSKTKKYQTYLEDLYNFEQNHKDEDIYGW